MGAALVVPHRAGRANGDGTDGDGTDGDGADGDGALPASPRGAPHPHPTTLRCATSSRRREKGGNPHPAVKGQPLLFAGVKSLSPGMVSMTL